MDRTNEQRYSRVQVKAKEMVRGYIEVMKDLWEEKGYGYLELKSQNLRNQASRLEKMLQDRTRNNGNFSLTDII